MLSGRRAAELLAAPVADNRLAQDLNGWIAQSAPNSCLVVEAHGETLFAHNGATPLAGASTQKIVTATALLLTMGPDERLQTVAKANGAAQNGVVAGDLFIVGGGNPLFTTPAYGTRISDGHGGAAVPGMDPAQLADAIVAAGVTQVQGSIVGDGSRYDAVRYHPSWRSSLLNNIGPVGALTVDDGRGGPNMAVTSEDPALNAAAVLTDLLRQRGVTITGEARAAPAPGELTDIAKLDSPPLRQIIAEMLTNSDNDTAEMALKEIGRQEAGAGSWEAGVAAATQLLQKAGIDTTGVGIVDGSGLSDDNRLTCQFVLDLLTRPDTGPILVEGMPIAGENGTLWDRFNNTPSDGRLKAKTGTLRNVTALSGLVEPVQGGSVVFSYMSNADPGGPGFTSADVNLQNGLADILVGYPRGVDLAQLVPQPPGG